MAENNLFQELNDVLQEFKTFLDDNVSTIAPAIQAIASLVPQVTELIDKLVDLMGKLRTEIDGLSVASIPGLEEATEFIDKIKAFLEAAKNLLPEEAGTIDDVLGVADVVGSLSGLDDVKTAILECIDAIVVHLNSLKPA